MRSGAAARVASILLAVAPTLAAHARVDHAPAEVQVRSGPGNLTRVTVRVRPETVIEDRTAGAQPAARTEKAAAAGQAFTSEITLFLREFVVARPGTIEVEDALVSSVRLFPEEQGTALIVFVRQPASYTVSRPSRVGEVVLEVRSRTPPPSGRLARRPSRPTPAQGDGREVAVDAQSLSYDQQANTLVARGGVTLTRGATTLTADEVRYDRGAGVVEARGNVVLTDPDATIEGDAGRLDLEDESGWIDSATADLRPSGYTVRAGRVLKEGGGPRYSIARGVFTTCECGGLERPSWSLAGRQTNVRLEGMGVVRDATFRIKDVPVLYFPYFLFPAKTDRQSGLLMPRVSYSNRRGFQYEQPLYWAINKSTDATVALDVESRIRAGVVGEYRYMFSRATRGAFTAGYFNEFDLDRTLEGVILPTGTTADDIAKDRWTVAGRHRQPFIGGSHLYLDAFAVSDVLFLRQINTFASSARRDLALRTARFTTTRTGAIRTWPRGLLWMDAAYYQDLVDPQEVTVHRLPRIDAQYGVPLLGDRVIGRVAAQGAHFFRDEGYAGLRGDLAPELFVPFRLRHYLNGSLTGQVRETAYYLTDDTQVAFVRPGSVVRFRAAPELPRLDTTRTRELGDVSARLGTEIARVFDLQHLGLGKLRHTIEPEVRYRYISPTGQPAHTLTLPPCASLRPGQRRPGDNCDATLFSEGYLFDHLDAINRRNFFSYGITTRLLARAATSSSPPAGGDEDDSDDEGAQTDGQPGSVDAETLAPGLPAETVPALVGPRARRPNAEPQPASSLTPPVRELLRAQILQGYDLSRELTPDSHLSDVDLGIRLTPLDMLGLTYNATVDLTGRRGILGQTVGFFVREPSWSPPSPLRNFQSASSVAISYRFVENNLNQGLALPGSAESLLQTQGVEEIDGSVYLRLGNYVGFTFLSRYDLSSTAIDIETGAKLGPHFLERDYFLRLISRCNCWVLDLGVADKFNPDERLFRIQLTLVGLGSFGRGTLPQSSFVGFAPLANIGYRRPGSVVSGTSY